MNMNMETLQRVFDKLIRSGGHTVIHGERAYQIYHKDIHAWLFWLPVEEYKKSKSEYDGSSVGWYTLLRIA